MYDIHIFLKIQIWIGQQVFDLSSPIPFLAVLSTFHKIITQQMHIFSISFVNIQYAMINDKFIIYGIDYEHNAELYTGKFVHLSKS